MTLIEQARIIAADMWNLAGPNRKAVLNGEWDDIRQVQCALLALETQAAEIARLRGLLGEAGVALVEAIIGVGDDYMTSEAHHPDYVLIPVAKFDQLVAAEEALKRGDIRAETGGGEDERP